MITTSISVSELSALLESGQPVTIVDIRRANDREWTIPGSLAVDAYDAVNAGQLGPMTGVTFPAQPVVMVCGVGRTAGRAAELLRATGVDAVGLEGGMRAWSTAWNTAETTVGHCQVVQVRRTGKGCLSYIVASDGAAIVIDASLELDVYIEELNARGWSLVGAADTHLHADHLSRTSRLAATSGAKVLVPDDNRIRFGSAELVAWQTPGHTTESRTYLLEDNAAAFTGDTLFVEGVGRPDLQGGASQASSNAAALYRSIQRLVRLPPSTMILPGHTAVPIPFDGVLVASTIGKIGRLPLLQKSKSEFVAATTEHLPPPPPNHTRIVAANERGEWPEGAGDLEAGANRCAVS